MIIFNGTNLQETDVEKLQQRDYLNLEVGRHVLILFSFQFKSCLHNSMSI